MLATKRENSEKTLVGVLILNASPEFAKRMTEKDGGSGTHQRAIANFKTRLNTDTTKALQQGVSTASASSAVSSAQRPKPRIIYIEVVKRLSAGPADEIVGRMTKSSYSKVDGKDVQDYDNFYVFVCQETSIRDSITGVEADPLLAHARATNHVITIDHMGEANEHKAWTELVNRVAAAAAPAVSRIR